MGVFLQAVFSNSFGHRLHIRSCPMKVNTSIDADLCMRLKLDSNGSDYKFT